MLTHKQLRAKALRDSEVQSEFDKTREEFALLDEFLKARTEQGLTQAQVAEKIGTTQSAVARMESGRGKHSPSIATLSRYAEALDGKLEIRLVRQRGRRAPGRRSADLPSAGVAGLQSAINSAVKVHATRPVLPQPHAEFASFTKRELHELADALLACEPHAVQRCVDFVVAETTGFGHGRARAMMCRRLKLRAGPHSPHGPRGLHHAAAGSRYFLGTVQGPTEARAASRPGANAGGLPRMPAECQAIRSAIRPVGSITPGSCGFDLRGRSAPQTPRGLELPALLGTPTRAPWPRSKRA